MPIQAALEKSEAWIIKCYELTEGVSFSTTNKLRVVVSLLHLSIEHHQAIHTLVDQGVYGSALALLRPQLETYVRGLWYHDCASDEQIQAVLAGGQPPRLSILLDALEKKSGFDGTVLKGIKRYLKNLHDFTHGGAIHIRARNTLNEVVSNYRRQDISGLVSASAALSLNAAVAIAGAIGDEELANRMFQEYKKIDRRRPVRASPSDGGAATPFRRSEGTAGTRQAIKGARRDDGEG